MNDNSKPSWFVLNLFQIIRVVFAGILLFSGAFPLLHVGETILDKDVKKIIITPVSTTITETTPLVRTMPAVTDSNKKTDSAKKEKQIIIIK